VCVVKTHRLQVGRRRVGQRQPVQALAQQRDREQRGVPLVEVVRADVLGLVVERAQQRHAADAEHRLLPQPVGVVAAVQVVGERPVLRTVLREVGVEQVDRQRVVVVPAHRVAPRGNRDGVAVDLDPGPRLDRLEHRLGRPRGVLLRLRARGVEVLPEVALAVHEGDADERQPQIGRRAQRVARQHAEPPGVGGDVGSQPDLHREVGHDRRASHGLAARHVHRRTSTTTPRYAGPAGPLRAIRPGPRRRT
jgi:hypothetical protein